MIEGRLRTVYMDNLQDASVPIKPANLLHALNQKMRAKESEKLTGIQKPEINDLMKLQRIPKTSINP